MSFTIENKNVVLGLPALKFRIYFVTNSIMLFAISMEMSNSFRLYMKFNIYYEKKENKSTCYKNYTRKIMFTQNDLEF